MKRMFWTSALLVAIGCASYPAPTQQLASSLAATRAAEEAGALLVPDAALHLKLADEQNTRAQQLMGKGDNKRAEGLASRAREDAELALAIAHEQDAKRRLDALAQAGSAGGEQTDAMPGPDSERPSMPSPTSPAPGPSTTP